MLVNAHQKLLQSIDFRIRHEGTKLINHTILDRNRRLRYLPPLLRREDKEGPAVMLAYLLVNQSFILQLV